MESGGAERSKRVVGLFLAAALTLTVPSFTAATSSGVPCWTTAFACLTVSTDTLNSAAASA